MNPLSRILGWLRLKPGQDGLDDPEPPPREWLIDVSKVAGGRWPGMDDLQQAIDDLAGFWRLEDSLPAKVHRQFIPNSWTRAVLHARSVAQARVDALLGEYRRWAALLDDQPS